MIGILLLLVALAVSLSLGLLAQDDPGYVLISRWPYEIEISLALLGAALIVTAVVAYFLVRLILRIFRSPRDVRTWRARRRRECTTSITHRIRSIRNIRNRERELTICT